MPSTPSAKEIPKDSIHGVEVTNWNGAVESGVELQGHRDDQHERWPR